MAGDAVRFGPAPEHWIRDAVRLQLDLEAFDGTQFVPYLQRCQQSGIGFTTMAAMGDTAECRRALYELDKECSADIPGQGAFYTFDEYVEQRMKPPGYDPQAIVLAVSQGMWVGMAATSLRHDEGCAVSDMTALSAKLS